MGPETETFLEFLFLVLIYEFTNLSYIQKYDTIIGSNLNIIVCDIAVILMNRIWGLNMGSRWDRYSLHTELFYI